MEVPMTNIEGWGGLGLPREIAPFIEGDGG